MPAYGQIYSVADRDCDRLPVAGKGDCFREIPKVAFRARLRHEAFLTEAVSLTADGDIFVLKSSGEILKFTSGERVEFEVAGLADGLSDAQRIYTHTDLPLLYVLDQGGKRLVLISKEGLFQKQYLLPEPVADFVVTSEDSIFFVSGSKLLRITEP